MKKIISVCIAILAFTAVFFPMPVYSQIIDLTASDAWFCEGFEINDAAELPDIEDTAWIKIPAHKDNRPVRIQNIIKPGFHPFRSIESHPIRNYTIKIPFTVTAGSINSDLMGVYFSIIGVNWEIYINGKLIKNEMHIKDGNILVDRAIFGELAGFSPSLLNDGTNLLTLHIAGKPNDFRTGLFLNKGYFIGDYFVLQKLTDSWLGFVFITIFSFAGLLTLALFFYIKPGISYFFFGFSELFFAVYVFTKTSTIYQIILDTWYIKVLKLDIIFIGLTCTALAFELFLKGKISNKLKTLTALVAIISVLNIFTEKLPVTLIAFFLCPALLLFVYISDILIPFVRLSIDRMKESHYSPSIHTSIIRSFIIPLIKTTHGNLAVAFGLIVISVSADMYLTYIYGELSWFSVYTFTILLCGVFLLFARKFHSLQKSNLELYDVLTSAVNARSRDILLGDIALGLYEETLQNVRSLSTKGEILQERTANSILQLSSDLDIISDLPSLMKAVLSKAAEIGQAQRGEILLFQEGTCEKIGKGNFEYQNVVFYDNKDWITSEDSRSIFVPIRISGDMIGICALARSSLNEPIPEETASIISKFISKVVPAIVQATVYITASQDIKTEKSSRISSGAEEKVSRTVEYINKHYMYDISRENLAAQLDINPDSLGKAFVKIMGMTIADYINDRRLEHAASKLKSSNDKIIDIAFASGFESLATFNRLFFKKFKCSPHEYRKR